MQYCHMPSPVGPLLLAGSKKTLNILSFPGGDKAIQPHADWVRSDSSFGEVKRQLQAYFAGELTQFDLRFELQGTPFQKKVWQTLATIPIGQTRTYGWLAKAVGSPKASRAVGAANGANPLPVILPCHRIIGANGKLTGFGGGLPTKKFLLELEGVKLPGEQLIML